MKKRFLPALCCALSALFILPAGAEGSSSSPRVPTVGDGGPVLVDILAMALAAVVLCAVAFLFYRVLRPRSKDEQDPSRRLKRK